ncbi:long-chain-fatty-acid--CoA ligase [Cryobacterium sp. TMT2-23]|uniref:long-chain-fatty-acid--CoA ligase n=1 Tax=Cryobacterium sp. TMT2-23 TaxID=1259252 RepID=UPI00106A0087|nr:long-chain-fatty-acid--CoA ligase [Cryobacterium sp. TMT2-23]TFD29111.1 long-chain-fatty-acid--CoA ligase [Cryobacterium sp. TMT2-23]
MTNNSRLRPNDAQPATLLEGLMQDWPLTLDRVVRRMESTTASASITDISPAGTRRRTFAETAHRIRRIGPALHGFGIQGGDRVATIGFNTPQHLELFLGVPAAGAVLHTVNPRLSEDHLKYIVAHGGSRLAFVDAALAPSLLPVLRRIPQLETVILLESDEYEDFLSAGERNDFVFPQLEERQAAALCYTSGTTGLPKGVLYSHRSNFLHALGVCLAEGMGISSRDTVLPVVPLFHANAWGLPHAAGLTGADLVLPGRDTSGEAVGRLIESEKVTFTAGVPTVLASLLEYAHQNPGVLNSLQTAVTGGAPMTVSLLEGYARHGVNLLQGWGMTETSPNVTLSRPPRHARGGDEANSYLMTAGRLNPLVDARIVSKSGEDLPWDGKAAGEIQLQSPHAAKGYYKDTEASAEMIDNGWLRTGDLATIDPDGYVRLRDRLNDLIKSGGEWIPTAELEQHILSSPAVSDVAVVARPDERWGERPVAFIVPGDEGMNQQELNNHLRSRVPAWWIPDTFHLVEQLPLTSVGKIDKKALREMLSS